MYGELFQAYAADHARQVREAEVIKQNAAFWQTGDEKALDALLNAIDLTAKERGETWDRDATRRAFLATYANRQDFIEKYGK